MSVSSLDDILSTAFGSSFQSQNDPLFGLSEEERLKKEEEERKKKEEEDRLRRAAEAEKILQEIRASRYDRGGDWRQSAIKAEDIDTETKSAFSLDRIGDVIWTSVEENLLRQLFVAPAELAGEYFSGGDEKKAESIEGFGRDVSRGLFDVLTGGPAFSGALSPLAGFAGADIFGFGGLRDSFSEKISGENQQSSREISENWKETFQDYIAESDSTLAASIIGSAANLGVMGGTALVPSATWSKADKAIDATTAAGRLWQTLGANAGNIAKVAGEGAAYGFLDSPSTYTDEMTWGQKRKQDATSTAMGAGIAVGLGGAPNILGDVFPSLQKDIFSVGERALDKKIREAEIDEVLDLEVKSPMDEADEVIKELNEKIIDIDEYEVKGIEDVVDPVETDIANAQELDYDPELDLGLTPEEAAGGRTLGPDVDPEIALLKEEVDGYLGSADSDAYIDPDLVELRNSVDETTRIQMDYSIKNAFENSHDEAKFAQLIDDAKSFGNKYLDKKYLDRRLDLSSDDVTKTPEEIELGIVPDHEDPAVIASIIDNEVELPGGVVDVESPQAARVIASEAEDAAKPGHGVELPQEKAAEVHVSPIADQTPVVRTGENPVASVERAREVAARSPWTVSGLKDKFTNAFVQLRKSIGEVAYQSDGLKTTASARANFSKRFQRRANAAIDFISNLQDGAQEFSARSLLSEKDYDEYRAGMNMLLDHMVDNEGVLIRRYSDKEGGMVYRYDPEYLEKAGVDVPDDVEVPGIHPAHREIAESFEPRKPYEKPAKTSFEAKKPYSKPAKTPAGFDPERRRAFIESEIAISEREAADERAGKIADSILSIPETLGFNPKSTLSEETTIGRNRFTVYYDKNTGSVHGVARGDGTTVKFEGNYSAFLKKLKEMGFKKIGKGFDPFGKNGLIPYTKGSKTPRSRKFIRDNARTNRRGGEAGLDPEGVDRTISEQNRDAETAAAAAARQADTAKGESGVDRAALDLRKGTPTDAKFASSKTSVVRDGLEIPIENVPLFPRRKTTVGILTDGGKVVPAFFPVKPGAEVIQLPEAKYWSGFQYLKASLSLGKRGGKRRQPLDQFTQRMRALFESMKQRAEHMEDGGFEPEWEGRAPGTFYISNRRSERLGVDLYSIVEKYEGNEYVFFESPSLERVMSVVENWASPDIPRRTPIEADANLGNANTRKNLYSKGITVAAHPERLTAAEKAFLKEAEEAGNLVHLDYGNVDKDVLRARIANDPDLAKKIRTLLTGDGKTGKVFVTNPEHRGIIIELLGQHSGKKPRQAAKGSGSNSASAAAVARRRAAAAAREKKAEAAFQAYERILEIRNRQLSDFTVKTDEGTFSGVDQIMEEADRLIELKVFDRYKDLPEKDKKHAQEIARAWTELRRLLKEFDIREKKLLEIADPDYGVRAVDTTREASSKGSTKGIKSEGIEEVSPKPVGASDWKAKREEARLKGMTEEQKKFEEKVKQLKKQKMNQRLADVARLQEKRLLERKAAGENGVFADDSEEMIRLRERTDEVLSDFEKTKSELADLAERKKAIETKVDNEVKKTLKNLENNSPESMRDQEAIVRETYASQLESLEHNIRSHEIDMKAIESELEYLSKIKKFYTEAETPPPWGSGGLGFLPPFTFSKKSAGSIAQIDKPLHRRPAPGAGWVKYVRSKGGEYAQLTGFKPWWNKTVQRIISYQSPAYRAISNALDLKEISASDARYLQSLLSRHRGEAMIQVRSLQDGIYEVDKFGNSRPIPGTKTDIAVLMREVFKKENEHLRLGVVEYLIGKRHIHLDSAYRENVKNQKVIVGLDKLIENGSLLSSGEAKKFVDIALREKAFTQDVLGNDVELSIVELHSLVNAYNNVNAPSGAGTPPNQSTIDAADRFVKLFGAIKKRIDTDVTKFEPHFGKKNPQALERMSDARRMSELARFDDPEHATSSAEVKKLAGRVVDIFKEYLDIEYANGLIAERQYKSIIEGLDSGSDDYVPFFRVLDHLQNENIKFSESVSGTASTNRANIKKGLDKYDPMIDIFQVMKDRHLELQRRLEYNARIKAFAKIMGDVNWGRSTTALEKKFKNYETYQDAEGRWMSDGAFVEVTSAERAKLLENKRANNVSEQNFVEFWDKGEHRIFKISEDMKVAMEGGLFGSATLANTAFGKGLLWSLRVMRMGAVLNPSFIVKNSIRDFFHSVLNGTVYGYNPFFMTWKKPGKVTYKRVNGVATKIVEDGERDFLVLPHLFGLFSAMSQKSPQVGLIGKTFFRLQEGRSYADLAGGGVDALMKRAGFKNFSMQSLIEKSAMWGEMREVHGAATAGIISNETVKNLSDLEFLKRDRYTMTQIKENIGKLIPSPDHDVRNANRSRGPGNSDSTLDFIENMFGVRTVENLPSRGKKVPSTTPVRYFQQNRSGIQIVGDTLMQPVNFLRWASDVSESIARNGTFRAIYLKSISQGMSKGEAIAAAREASRNISLDFRQNGGGGRFNGVILNQAKMFHNAAVQDTMMSYRVLRNYVGNMHSVMTKTGKAREEAAKQLVKDTAAISALVTLPSVLAHSYWNEDSDYRKQPEWRKLIAMPVMKVTPDHFLWIPRPLGIAGFLTSTLPAIMIEEWEKMSKGIPGNDATPEEIAEHTGMPLRVVDGDTLHVTRLTTHGEAIIKYRIENIDSPEIGYEFAAEAKKRLEELIGDGANIQIVENGTGARGRRLATLIGPNGEDIGRQLIEEGLAYPYGNNLKDREAYIRAMKAQLGIHSGEALMHPSAQRKEKAAKMAENLANHIDQERNTLLAKAMGSGQDMIDLFEDVVSVIVSPFDSDKFKRNYEGESVPTPPTLERITGGLLKASVAGMWAPAESIASTVAAVVPFMGQKGLGERGLGTTDDVVIESLAAAAQGSILQLPAEVMADRKLFTGQRIRGELKGLRKDLMYRDSTPEIYARGLLKNSPFSPVITEYLVTTVLGGMGNGVSRLGGDAKSKALVENFEVFDRFVKLFPEGDLNEFATGMTAWALSSLVSDPAVGWNSSPVQNLSDIEEFLTNEKRNYEKYAEDGMEEEADAINKKYGYDISSASRDLSSDMREIRETLKMARDARKEGKEEEYESLSEEATYLATRAVTRFYSLYWKEGIN